MLAKILEVRDRGTFIPMLCVEMRPTGPNGRYLLRRAGYDCEKVVILMTRADGKGKAYYDPYDWGDRTFKIAHDYIEKYWLELSTGDVIDVEFILGETTAPKQSERFGGV